MKRTVGLSALVAALALVGCGGEQEAESPSSTAVLKSAESTAASEASSEPSSEAPAEEPQSEEPQEAAEEPAPSGEIIDVDPEGYVQGQSHMFRYTVGGESGECYISDKGVACTGQAPEDAPEVEMAPLPRQKPGAIAAGENGLYYTIFEGVPPAQKDLEPGQRIAAGAGVCTAENADLLRCESNGKSFSIQAPGKKIVPESELAPVFDAQ
ncbi:hypothetical protein [Corynebacterium pseudopelargi]|uniref:Lipoprotein n=1 Tax=Corynebacterium pseudopelargi TaxID=2080757 RepID=A0A3G6ISU9_9CORY|nr:hypothetical protein [Corynebacterium pseudopelargi]AZA08587.1 hypothetical protein CPPEL_02250 [Corynebacterium pseudopelargi]